MYLYIKILIYLFMLFYGALGILSFVSIYKITEEGEQIDMIKVLSFIFIGFLSQFIGYFLLKTI